jgi:hypothetical protein
MLEGRADQELVAADLLHHPGHAVGRFVRRADQVEAAKRSEARCRRGLLWWPLRAFPTASGNLSGTRGQG